MSTVALKAVTHDGGTVLAALPLSEAGSSCRVRLRCLPGASGLHLVVEEGEHVHLRAELPLPAGEEISVKLERDPEGKVVLMPTGRRVSFLPPDRCFEPPVPLRPGELSAGLDLVWLIDGTVRFFDSQANEARQHLRLLLAEPEAWARHVETVVGLTSALVDRCQDVRLTVLAFGDDPLPGATAPDLLPSYRLRPQREEDRVLRPFTESRLREQLLNLEPTPGGDFVDALADALAAVRRLVWRDGARRLVILDGDSPGFSLLHPVPRGADAGARRVDVDSEAMALHGRGIEFATLYHDGAWGSGYYGSAGDQGKLLIHAREQYRRLASRPETAFELSNLDPQRAAEILATPPDFLGRGTSIGQLLEIRASGSPAARNTARGKKVRARGTRRPGSKNASTA